MFLCLHLRRRVLVDINFDTVSPIKSRVWIFSGLFLKAPGLIPRTLICLTGLTLQSRILQIRWWTTEKIFNCFTCKTVLIYWGCRGDLSMLEMWGFSTKGVIVWDGSIASLEKILVKADETLYQRLIPIVQKNYERQKELACFERALAILCINELNGATAQMPTGINYDRNNKFYRKYVLISDSGY